MESAQTTPINQSTIKDSALALIRSLEGSDSDFLDKYEHLRITVEKDIPQPEPTITIAGAAIASPGNISAISAAAKAGKTAVVGVISAGAISSTGSIDGFADLEVAPNVQGKAVVCFDTEQSEADQQYNLRTVLKRAGLQQTPEYYRAYNIRQLNSADYQKVTDAICDGCAQRFGGIHIIIVDGGADYILSVNDEAAASGIVQYFTHLAIKYACPVIVIVHQNPGSDKERGHFGSEIQRKCYGLLTLSKEGDISTLAPKIMRKAGHGDVPLISFRFCKEKGYHVPTETVDKENARNERERNRLKLYAEQVFTPLIALSYKEAVSKIMQASSKGQTTAKSMLANMDGYQYIIKGPDNLYRINNKNEQGQ